MDHIELNNALLARVAYQYFEKNKTTQEIAEGTGIPRNMISHLINEARERGVVEIKVHFPWTSRNLETALVEKFGLKDARVMELDAHSYSEFLSGLGILVADYVSSILHDDMVIGISWGSAIQHMIQALKPRKMHGIEVVQMIGATGLESNLSDGPLLARQLTDRLNAICHYLHAPLIVDNKTVRDAILKEPEVKNTLVRASKAEIALVGIGSIHPDLYSLKIAGYVTEEQRLQFADEGVVGDCCGFHFSIDGNLSDIDINNRVVGIDRESLRKIGTVIAVAGDTRKGDAILGALRGKFTDVLVTDAETAQYLLDHK